MNRKILGGAATPVVVVDPTTHKITGGPAIPIVCLEDNRNGVTSPISSLQIGDVTAGNYVLINENGIRLFGTAAPFDDLEGALIGARINSPSGRIDYNYDEGTVEFQDNCIYPTDFVTIIYQMRHRYQFESVVEPHLHWIQDSALFPNWVILSRVTLNGGLVPAAFDGPFKPTQTLFTWNSGNLLQYSDFADIAGRENLSFSLDIKLYRDTTNVSTLYSGADPISGNVAAKFLDCHFQNDMLGSFLELQKYPT